MIYSDTLKWDLCIMLKLHSVTVQEYAVSYYRYINTFLSIIDNKWQIFNERTESLFGHYLCSSEPKMWSLLKDKISYLEVKCHLIIAIVGFFNALRLGY